MSNPTTLTMGTVDTLRALQAQIGAGNARQGFHDQGARVRAAAAYAAGYYEVDAPARVDADANVRHYVMAKLGLIVTEASEGIEEVRKGHPAGVTYYSGGTGYGLDRDDLQPHERFDANGAQRKPEGLRSELSDVIIRAFDLAFELDLDLAADIDEKLTYNATRARLHGKKL